jgi:hypothetical protein
MAFEITGRVIDIFETIQVSGSFRKREFVIEKKETSSGTDFTDYIKLQLTQDRCSLADQIQVNDEIRVSFNIRGNRWEKDGRVSYFTNLDVWKIEKLTGELMDQTSPPLAEEDIPPPTEEYDDLPF